MHERLQTVPGVLAVGAANVAPFNPTFTMPLVIEGRPAPHAATGSGGGVQLSPPVANYYAVTTAPCRRCGSRCCRAGTSVSAIPPANRPS